MRRIHLATLLVAASALPLTAEPHRYIVELSTAAQAAQGVGRRQFRAEAAAVAVVRYEYSRLFPGAAVELRKGQTAAALARLPNVVAVHEDSEVRALADPAPQARAVSRTQLIPRPQGVGTGVVVAVIDTGIDGTHPALAGKVIGGYDFVNHDDDPMDDAGHGTHVAGIIAARSDEMTGVAPGVRLLAYKVLDENGRGTFSDIIAALERAVDPNGDGDPSDHAAVANLSLGGTGSPDDPLARTVNNAVAIGMIVCAAAGNVGGFHHIGTPAGAARAITVGASTLASGAPIPAFFTSRGPAPLTGAIKPDVLAPGVDVNSTYLDHGFATLSGTSMATPYVAGLAAILVEEHPGWSPDRIKAALASTAHPLANEEVMTQGSGEVDLAGARGSRLFADPTQLNFGLDAGPEGGDWSAQRRFTLRNDGGAPLTVHITPQTSLASINVVVSPNQVTLAPGQSTEVEATINVHNVSLPQSSSFSVGGTLLLTANGAEARLPWAFVHGARLVVTSPGAVLDASFQSAQPLRNSPARFAADGLEYLMEPGVADFVISAATDDDLRVAVAEGKEISGEVSIVVTAADTPHTIHLSSVDETGKPLPQGDGTNSIHALLPRLLLPDGRAVPLIQTTGRVVRTAPLSDRYGLLVSETFIDEGASRVYIAQYPLLHGVSGDRTLELSPDAYAAQPIEVSMPASQQRNILEIAPTDVTSDSVNRSIAPRALFFEFPGRVWRGLLYMTKEVHPNVSSILSIQVFDPEFPIFPSFIGPGIHRSENGFFTTNAYAETALPMRLNPNDTLALGASPVHLPFVLQVSENLLFGEPLLCGDRGEGRLSESYLGAASVRDESGAVVAEQPVQVFVAMPLPRRGRYTATLRFPGLTFDDRTATSLVTASFDTRQGDSALPAVTSFIVLDEANRHTTRLKANGSGSIVFSGADTDLAGYHAIAGDRTKLYYRRHAGDAWTPLQAVIIGEQTDQPRGNPIGLIYRADLTEALRGGPGECEIAVEIADVNGNTVRMEAQPAFIVDPEHTGRLRAIGRGE